MTSAVTSCYFWRSLTLIGLRHPIPLFNGLLITVPAHWLWSQHQLCSWLPSWQSIWEQATMSGCTLLHRAMSCWKALKTGAILQRELGNAWKLRVGGGLSALQTWSATPLGSRQVGFSNPCYMSLVIAKIDHLRWKYRWICCWWQLTRTLLSIQVHWYAYLLYWKKKIISSSTLGRCFCRIRICYFIPTCCSNISSAIGITLWKALRSTVAMRIASLLGSAWWLQDGLQISTGTRSLYKEQGGWFFPASPSSYFLPVPLLTIKSKVFVNVISWWKFKGQNHWLKPRVKFLCFFLPSDCQTRTPGLLETEATGLCPCWLMEASSTVVCCPLPPFMSCAS